MSTTHTIARSVHVAGKNLYVILTFSLIPMAKSEYVYDIGHLMMLIAIIFGPCSIVRSFETIVSVFAQQQEDGDRFSVMTDSILFVAELVSWMHIHLKELALIMTCQLCDV